MVDLNLYVDTPPWEWPQKAAKDFREVLTNPQADTAQRKIAAELAGDYTVINDDLSAVLLRVFNNPAEPEDLRAKVAISFGPALASAEEQFDDAYDEELISKPTYAAIRDALHKAYDDPGTPKLVRRRALEASVRAGDTWHPDAVRAAYNCGDPEWVLTAVFCMCYIPGFNKEILESLDNPDPMIHFEAVDAAGNWELEAAWPHVRRLLQDKRTPQPLMIAAITAAANIAPDEAEEYLLKLAKSKDEEIAEAAEEALSVGMLDPDDEEEDEE